MRISLFALVSTLLISSIAAKKDTHLHSKNKRKIPDANDIHPVRHRDVQPETVVVTISRFHTTCPCTRGPAITQSPVLATAVAYVEYDYSYYIIQICDNAGSCFDQVITASTNPNTITTYVPAQPVTIYQTLYQTVTTTECANNVCQPTTTVQPIFATSVATTYNPIMYTGTYTVYQTVATSTCTVCQVQTATVTSLSTVTRRVSPIVSPIITNTFTATATVTTSTCALCPQSAVVVTTYNTVVVSAIPTTVTTTTCSNGACYTATYIGTTYTTVTANAQLTSATLTASSSTSTTSALSTTSTTSSVSDIGSPILASTSTSTATSSATSINLSTTASTTSISSGSTVVSNTPTSATSSTSTSTSTTASTSTSSTSSLSLSSSSSSSSSTILIFSSTTGSITSTTVTSPSTTIASTPPTQTTNIAGMDYISAMLLAHNIHRTNHSEAQLTWDSDLANAASQLAQTCIYGHSTTYTYSKGSYGQNIGAGAPDSSAPLLISNNMYNDEIENYPLPYGDNNPSLANFSIWGHYSQLVWNATTFVGCATEYCPNGLANVGPGVAPYFTVCDYYPAGNVVGSFSQVLPPQGGATVVLTYQTT